MTLEAGKELDAKKKKNKKVKGENLRVFNKYLSNTIPETVKLLTSVVHLKAFPLSDCQLLL